MHLLVSRILDASGVEYRTDEPIFPASSRHADFAVGNRLFLLGGDLSPGEKKKA